MKVHVKFIGIPDAIKAVGKKEITTEVDDPTLGALLRTLDTTYGARLHKALFNQKGDVDDSVQILHNGADFMARDAPGQRLGDGDQVTFMMMMAGG